MHLELKGDNVLTPVADVVVELEHGRSGGARPLRVGVDHHVSPIGSCCIGRVDPGITRRFKYSPRNDIAASAHTSH